MPKQTKTCRVCGATYEACNSIRTGSKVFNWREVACSPECGMVYLDRITASRSIVEPVEEPDVLRFPLKEVTETHETDPEMAEEEVIPDEPVMSEMENVEATE